MNAGEIGAALASASQPVTVHVINQGPGIWGNVATGLITAVAAIAGVMLTHRFTLKRERLAAEDRLQRERYFIATELVFKLEEYAEKCAYVGLDKGSCHGDVFDGFLHTVPDLDLLSVTADWRALPSHLLYRVRELSAQHERASRGTDLWEDASDHGDPEAMSKVLRYRQGQFLKQGLLAMFLSIRLRRLCNMAGSPLFKGHHSTGKVMWDARRKLRREAYEEAVRYREFHKAAPAVTG